MYLHTFNEFFLCVRKIFCTGWWLGRETSTQLQIREKGNTKTSYSIVFYVRFECDTKPVEPIQKLYRNQSIDWQSKLTGRKSIDWFPGLILENKGMRVV